MKREVYLNVEYLEVEGKKISKVDEQKLREGLCKDSIKLFKSQMKNWLSAKDHKITKEYFSFEPSVVIQFPDEDRDVTYDMLRAADIVSSIDSFLRPEDQ